MTIAFAFDQLTEEIAREVKVAERTVKNDWALARDRLAEIRAEPA